MLSVLVLGGTGQLGSNLVRALLNEGHQVRVLVRSSSHLRTLTDLPVEIVQGNLQDSTSLLNACRGCSTVYHAAGFYPTSLTLVQDAVQQALLETNYVLDAVQRTSVERLVFASSLTTIGFPQQPGQLADETCSFSSLYPRNSYLMAKTVMEERILDAARSGVPAVVVNPTVFFGPFDSQPTSGTQILMVAKGLMSGYVQGDVNVIDVRDVAVGMIRAAERGRVGERYILGHWNTTQQELNQLIARLAGVSAPWMRLPFFLARWGTKFGDWTFRMLNKPSPVPSFFIEMLPHLQQYDCSKAIRELDLPQSPIEPAITDALTWFRQHGYLAS